MNTAELGRYGETLAEAHLLEKGFKIVEKNLRFKKLEVDLVAMKNDLYIFVEVKTRQTAEIGEPWMAVTKHKQRQIIQVADHYLKVNDIENEARFDVISIVHNQFRTNIEHIENAFYPLA